MLQNTVEYGAQPMHFDIYEFLRFPPFLCYVCMLLRKAHVHLAFENASSVSAFGGCLFFFIGDDFKNRTRKKKIELTRWQR